MNGKMLRVKILPLPVPSFADLACCGPADRGPNGQSWDN